MLSPYEVKLITSPADIREAFRLRFEVYCHEYCYLAPEECPDGIERDRWDKIAYHLGVVAPDGQIVGTARLVPNSEIGLPTGDYGTLPSVDDRLIIEVSRLAFHHDVRGVGNGLLIDMWRAVIHESRARGARYLYASMLTSTWKLLLKVGFYFHLIGEAKLWSRAASPSVMVIPTLLDMESCDRYFQHANPKVYNYIYGNNPGTAQDDADLEAVLRQEHADREQVRQYSLILKQRAQLLAHASFA